MKKGMEATGLERTSPRSTAAAVHQDPVEMEIRAGTWWSSDALIAASFFVVAFALRLGSAARAPTEWDSAQLAFGVDRFDVTEHSPHPPGYYLYVAAGRLVRALTPFDAHASMVIVAALVMAMAIAGAYLAGTLIAGRRLGWALALFLLSSPYTWFYGSIANSYGVEVLLGAALLTLAVRSHRGSWYGRAAVASLGLAAGFRLSSLVFFAPLAAVSVIRSVRTVRDFLTTAAAGVTTVAAWLVPMALEQPGGLSAWWAATHRLWDDSAATTALYRHGPYFNQNFRHALVQTIVALGPVIPIGVLGFLALGAQSARRRRLRLTSLRLPGLFLLAGAPAFLSGLLVFFGKPGYVLSWLVPFALLCCWPLSRISRWPAAVLMTVLVAGAATSGYRFLFARELVPKPYITYLPRLEDGAFSPPRVTRREILETDLITTRYRQLGRQLDPRRDVLVWVLGNGGEWSRHGSFALENFIVDLVWGNRLSTSARDGRWGGADLPAVEVPPGGRAVFVLNNVPEALERSGVRQSASQPAVEGLNLVAVDPGPTPFGVPVVTVSKPYEPGVDRSHWP